MKSKVAILVSSILIGPLPAFGVDTAQLSCRTTAECNRQAAKSGAAYFGIPASGNRSTKTAERLAIRAS